jgi:hypothetical protein
MQVADTTARVKMSNFESNWTKEWQPNSCQIAASSEHSEKICSRLRTNRNR